MPYWSAWERFPEAQEQVRWRHWVRQNWAAGSGAAPVLSAGLGRASSIGALSVPPSWAAATPPIRLVATAWPNTLAGAAPTVHAASPENLLNETLLASMALRGVGGAAAHGRPAITKTVTPRPRMRNWG